MIRVRLWMCGAAIVAMLGAFQVLPAQSVLPLQTPPPGGETPLFANLATSGSELLAPAPRTETTMQPPKLPVSIPPPLVYPDQRPAKLPVLSDAIHVDAGAVKLNGFASRPMQGTLHGTVLLVPEWWGLNKAMRDQAETLAAKGYHVFAVDLYDGKTTTDRREAARLMSQMKPERALAQLKAAMDYLTKAAADGRKPEVAVVGWGSGGGLALKFATQEPRCAALVIFYGDLIDDAGQLAKLKTPTLGIFANLDGWVTPAKVTAFKKALSQAGVPFNIVSYDVLPGFALAPRDTEETSYAELANTQMLEFLSRQLGGGAAGAK